jgi:ParB family chromosome partitioning protein
LIKDINDKKKKKTKKKSSKPAVSYETALVLEDTEDKLRHIFGTQVKITPKSEESGTIELEFYSRDDLERLLEMFALIGEKNFF